MSDDLTRCTLTLIHDESDDSFAIVVSADGLQLFRFPMTRDEVWTFGKEMQVAARGEITAEHN